MVITNFPFEDKPLRVLAAIVKGLRDGGINFASPLMELRGGGLS